MSRGVLADVARFAKDSGDVFRAMAPFVITPSLIDACLSAEGVELVPGDILMIRTGYVAEYLHLSPYEQQELGRDLTSAGLSPGEETSEFLWDHRVAGVVMDNPGIEVIPRDDSKPFLHTRLIPMLGYLLGELFDLEALAAKSASDGRYTSLFTAAPLNLPGGVGSPGNALAVR